MHRQAVCWPAYPTANLHRSWLHDKFGQLVKKRYDVPAGEILTGETSVAPELDDALLFRARLATTTSTRTPRGTQIDSDRALIYAHPDAYMLTVRAPSVDLLVDPLLVNI